VNKGIDFAVAVLASQGCQELGHYYDLCLTVNIARGDWVCGDIVTL